LNQEIYSNDELSRQIEVLLRDKKMLMEELEVTNALVVTSVRSEMQQEQLSKETWNREMRDLVTSIDSLRKENERLQESLSSLYASLRNELQRNSAAFNIPIDAPPDYSVNPPAALPARKAARAANLAEQKDMYLVVAAITRDQFTAAINDVYCAALNDPTEGLNAITLHELVVHIRTTYATISQPDIDDNMVGFHTGIDSHLPLAVYTRKQEKCQTFALDTGIPISEVTMVLTGTNAAINCGGMELA
jgi:hypothetical protein